MTRGYGRGYALEMLERLMADRGPLVVDCHRHLASEYTIDGGTYSAISDGKHLNQKWSLMDTLRREDFYLDTLSTRLNDAIRRMKDQRIGFCRTYAEIDSFLGIRVVEAIHRVKEDWKENMTLQIAAYPFQGIGDTAKLKRAEQALEMSDLLGCLPSRGRKNVGDSDTTFRNMRELFALAQRHNKPIDLQIDQDNHPDERESEVLVQVAQEFRDKGYEQSITATHCISLSAQTPVYRESVIKGMSELDIRVVTCPSAALGMKHPETKNLSLWDRLRILLRIHRIPSSHNSIAPVTELIEAGVIVGIGSDNVADLYEAFTTGDIREEMRMMLSAIRWTGPIETIADMMTQNGRKILGV